MYMASVWLILSTLSAIVVPYSFINATVNHVSPSPNNIDYTNSTESEINEYYSSLTEGQKGDELLDNLQNILKEGQIKVDYNTGYIEGESSKAWYGYSLYERNYDLSPLTEQEKNGKFKTNDIWINVLYLNSPIYIESSFNDKNYKYYPNYPDLTGGPVTCLNASGAGLDREHILPKSFGFNMKDDREGYKDLTAGCDAHNLHAGDSQANQQGHNSYPYGNVVDKNSDETKEITSKITGEIVGYLGFGSHGTEVFEPIDKDKGDIARSIFYMCARYHNYEDLGNGDETPAITLGNGIDKGTTRDPIETKDNPVAYGELDDLLKWNIEDPVSKYEITRNDLIYKNVQGNRNPFVDYPDWANACFDPENSDGIKFSNLNGSAYSFKIEATSEFKTSYNFLDNFSSKGLTTTLTEEDKEIEPVSVKYYLNNNEIKDGDTLLAFGNQDFFAMAETESGTFVSSNTIHIEITFSTLQMIIAGAVIVLILIILIIIFANLSKRNKKKVRKAVKNRLTKTRR